MKKVEFVRVRSELCGYGLGKGSRYSFKKAEELKQCPLFFKKRNNY